EKNDKLAAGGQLRIGAFPPFKQPLTREIRYMLHMCEKHGVEMKWNTEATPELIKELKPDVLIMATGATPLVPKIKGLEETGVVLANNVLLGTPVLQKSALIIGGGEVGAETAEYATDYCSRVAIVEMLPEIVPTLYLTVRNAMLKRIKEEEIEVYTNTKVLEFIPGGVIAEKDGKQITLDGFDTVILALGSRPYVPFETEGLADKVYTIGDADAVKDAKWAIYKAYQAAMEI
ncbi:MAG: FAD-dependent oxidoreductase, partial [Erysipelotrichaceae bacterium]|nr:FAD-dependent oxidoreductase [Erysipelotrichaceae bacterium]